jgi:hypothetical protein
MQYMGGGEFRSPHKGRCDKELVIGETLTWAPVEHRSSETHRHLFACIKNAWDNLPEALAAEYPSPEALRKWALIQIGHCSMVRLAFANNAEAMKAAMVMREIDGYAEIGVNGNAVVMRRAKSIARGAVRSRKDFAEIKEKVLTTLSQLIGADVAAEAA